MHHLTTFLARSVLVCRLFHRGKGVHGLPLPLSGGAAGGGAAGGAVRQSSAKQQAERTTWLDF